MALAPIPLKADVATKEFIDASGYPLEEEGLPTIEYGVDLLLHLTYYDVNVVNLTTPIVAHPFQITNLFATRGDYDFDITNELMFLTQEIIGTPPLWTTITGYVIGDRVVSTAGDWYLCTVDGTSGVPEPTWDTDIGDTTTDGTVTWTRVPNNDGVNQPGDWESGGTANKTLGQISVRINTLTAKFNTFMGLLSIKRPKSTLALIQMFIVESGSSYFSTILNSPFQASGTVDTQVPVSIVGNPAYLNEVQSDAKFVNRTTFNLASVINLVIAAGVVTRNNSVHTIEPQTGTTDDLDTINGLLDGECCILKLQDPANDTITLKHLAGNIVTPDGNDFVLKQNNAIILIGNGSGNVEIILPMNPGSFTKRDVQDIVNGATALIAFDGFKLVRADTTAGDADITLHAAAGWSGELEIFKEVAANAINITGTVNGVVNPSFTSIRGSLRIINDGSDNFVTPDPITP